MEASEQQGTADKDGSLRVPLVLQMACTPSDFSLFRI